MSVKRNKSIVALLLAVSMVMSLLPMSSVKAVEESIPKQGWYNTEENTGDMNRVPYNNPSQIADLNMGMCSYPVVVDMNEDGIMDLLVYGGAIAEEQVKIFYGTEEGGLVMEKGRKLNPDGYATKPFSATYFYDKDGNYEKTGLHVTGNRNVYDAKDYPIGDEDTPFITRSSVNIYQWESIDGNANASAGTSSSLASMVDYDGDGVLDCLNYWDCWYEGGWLYGADHRYDENGIWGGAAGSDRSLANKELVGVKDGDNDPDGVKDGDPLHGWVAWSKNTGTTTAHAYGEGTTLVQVYEYEIVDNKKVAVGEGKALDVYGAPTVSLFDWDQDGDLDIIAGSWVHDLIYFENIGTRTEPKYIVGRPVVMPNGKATKTDMCQVVTTGFDWDNDGDMDLILGEEDGRVSFVECVGVAADGTPIMKAPVRFQAYADSLDFGTLISIDSVDWDGDGDEDIIAGEDSGRISMIKNITIEKGLKEGKKKEEIDLSNPIWGDQVYLTNPQGEVYRITAGHNGSLQGPSEELFGYSKVDTGDWDGDGVLDIISNNIWGIILFHKGIKTTDGSFKAENPVPIEVDWIDGVKYPEWNWWAPGEETLGVEVIDPAGRVYEAQWPWWNEVKSENELVVQWRTSPCLVELPIKDPETKEVRIAKGLAVIDYEGYLSFYEQYKDGDTYKVKDGQRIFMDSDGVTPLRMVAAENTHGESGRRQFILADYNNDGKLDYIANNGINAAYRQNVATEEGVYKFGGSTTLHTRQISQHVPSPTVCDWDQDGYLDVLMGDEGGNVYYLKNTIYHPIEKEDEEEEDVDGTFLKNLENLDEFTRVTPFDYGIADGRFTGQTERKGNKKPVLSLNKVLFETSLQYETRAIYFEYGSLVIQIRTDGFIRIWNYYNNAASFYFDGADAGNTFDINPWYAIDSSVSSFMGREFVFSITTEYVDYDADGNGANDLKIGFWVDGKLYLDKYLYLKDVTDTIGTTQIKFYGAGDDSVFELTSKDLFKDFAFVTPKDFGIDDGTYAAVPHTTVPIASFDKVFLRARITYRENGTFLRYGDFAFQLRSSASTVWLWNYYSYDGQQLVWNNNSTTVDFSPSKIVGSTSYIDNAFDFAISTEYVDYDGDGEKDDIKLGVWFDGVLYDSNYFYSVNAVHAIAKTKNYRFAVEQNGSLGKVSIASPNAYEMAVQPEITDSIALNYTATIDPMILKTGEVSMTFEMNGRDPITVPGIPTTPGGNVFTGKYTDIMGQDMAEKIGVTVHVGSSSKYYEYSVLDYCVDVLNDKYATYSMETKELIVDLVEYGAALQTYRGVAEKYLFTKVLEEKVPNYATFDKTDGDVQALAGLTAVAEKLTTEQTASETEAYDWYSVSLVLNNKVKIRAKFTASDISNLTVKAVVEDVELQDALEIQGTSTAGVYQVDFDEIYAYEYGKQISFRVYEGNAQVGQTLNYSVDTYLKEMYEYSDKLATLLVAINNYGNAAKAYQFPE